MSNPFTPQPQHGYVDAKAQAKAAKAYAKAQRPWYKKKRFLLPLILLALILFGSLAGGGNDDPAPATTGIDSETQQRLDNIQERNAEAAEAQAAEPVPTPEPVALDPASFTAVDDATWAAIAANPDAAAGQRVVVYAEVSQFDGATGPGRFLANAGGTQPVSEYELETNTVFSGEEETLAPVLEGKVLRVYGEVVGAFEYETSIGGNTVAPQIEALAVEEVGFLDITGDAVLGAATPREYGGVEIPVTVTNSATSVRGYTVEIVAESADGTMQLDTGSAYIENLGPGQVAVETVTFFDDLPSDAVYRVVAVDRNDY